MRRNKGGHHARRLKGRLRRDAVHIPKNCIMNTMILIPLNAKTGLPIMSRVKVLERGKVRKGMHSRYRALLTDDNRIFRMGEIFYLREVWA